MTKSMAPGPVLVCLFCLIFPRKINLHKYLPSAGCGGPDIGNIEKKSQPLRLENIC